MTLEEIQLKAYELTEKDVDRLYKQLVDDYRQAMQDIDRTLRNMFVETLDDIPVNERYNYMTKYNRLESLLKDVQSKYMTAARRSGRKIEQSAKLAMANSYYRQMYSINWATNSDVFIALNPKVIEVSVYGTPVEWGRLAEIYGNKKNYIPQAGTLIKDLIKKRRPQVLSDIESTIRQGLIQGQGYKKTSASIRDIMGTDIKNAERIVRTESHRTMTTGNYAMKQAAQSEGVDVRRVIVSTLDSRTRPQSVTVDDKMETEDGYFIYPGGVRVKIPGNSGRAKWDVNDRESVIQVVNGKRPELRRGRDPVTGETDIISYKNFDKWAKEKGLKYNDYGQLVGT